jgi:DNA-binding NarL/FixJ family response regulator
VSGPRAISVLVVDDDPRVRAALVRLLDDVAGLQVAAVDVEQAVRLSSLTSLETDVAVVDLAGPASPGEDVVRRLAPRVQVVAVSLSGTVRAAALRAGASVFLEKDGDDRGLIEAIRTAASGVPGQNVASAPGHASHLREGTRDV